MLVSVRARVRVRGHDHTGLGRTLRLWPSAHRGGRRRFRGGVCRGGVVEQVLVEPEALGELPFRAKGLLDVRVRVRAQGGVRVRV
jgi:hypothetical protein